MFYIFPSSSFAWWDSSWQYRFKYTIDNSGVGETLTDFPLHIDLTNDAPAHFWAYVAAGGTDIRVIDENDSTNLSSQAHLEGFDKASSKGHLWVKKTITTTGNADFVWVYYGNSGASSAFSDTTKQNTYNNNYAGVWHLDETSGTHYDGTTNNKDSTSITITTQGSAIGQINGCDLFGGNSDSISMGDVLDFERTNPFTFEAWIKNSATHQEPIISKLASSSPNNGFEFGYNASTPNVLYFALANNYSTNAIVAYGSKAVNDGIWHYAVVSYNGSSNGSGVNFYVDGSLGNGSVPRNSLSATTLTAYDFKIGYRSSTIYSGNSNVDEVRVSNIVRSAEWVEFAYKSDGGNGGSSEDTQYIISAEPTGADVVLASDWSTNVDNSATGEGQTGVVAVGVQNESYRIATFNADFDQSLDWSDLTVDSDGSKALFHYDGGFTSLPGSSGSTYTLYIPTNNKPYIRICPDATSLEEVTSACSNGYLLTTNDINVSKVIEGETEYYKVSGLSSTGGEGEDPSISFSVIGVGASTVTNGITTSVGSDYNTLPFGNLISNTPKYMAHYLSASTNANSGYTVYVKLLNTLQGEYPANMIDPFDGSWTTPQAWFSPTGSVPNINTGWIGANTSDTRVSGWSDGSGKFGPLSTISHPVMYSSTIDTGTNAYVTYAIETNVHQPSDLYMGTIIYNILPTY
ncbi:LamG domain-containing protein [Candidatus Beckwithbacteria bacterium]|nr:LamG domain-containing protein [Candidatus Beckwithbacteria bacterium]